MKNLKLVLEENEERLIPLVWSGGSEEMALDVTLAGRGAKVNILGAFILANSDQLKLNVNVKHSAPDTSSDTLIKSVLAQKAVGGFYGLVSIKKGAKNTTTFFREDALLLSDAAKAEAIPSLEIDENEVKAGHASTVSPINLEQLFYLQSRGINYLEAKRLLVNGFFQPIFEIMPQESLIEFEKSLAVNII